MSNASKSPLSVVAVTGAQTYLGTEILRELSDDPSIDRVVALDVAEPDVISDKLSFHHLDLSSPSAGTTLSEILRETSPDSIVHAAFLSSPSHNSTWAHELEDIGTMHVLDACARHQPSRFLLLSSTMVYGAKAINPNYISEDVKLGDFTASRFVNDKIKAEEQVLRFARNNEEIDVCSLRFSPILGPTIENFYTRFLSRPLAPTVSGYDPLIQIVHEADAVRASLLALQSNARGAFNIVGKDVLPYTTVLALLARLPFPMPRPIAELVGSLMWALRLSEAPASMLDMIQYLCVADGQKAASELGFVAAYDIRQTLGDFLGMPEERTRFPYTDSNLASYTGT